MPADPAIPYPPLRDPVTSEEAAADLVRGVLGLDDILSGSLLLVLCDDERRPTVPVLITDVPVTAPVGLVLDHWFEHLSEQLAEAGRSLVFARARPGQSFVVDHDRTWHEAVVRGCRRSGIRLLGAFVVTQHAAIPFPPPIRPNGPAAGERIRR